MDHQLQTQLNRMYPPRDWADISGNWLNYINAITPPGSRPSAVIEEFYGFEQIARSFNPTSPRQQRQDVVGFHQIAFHESIYLLHKASHVIGCSETDANIGAHTWALSQAYQGSYFAAKSICHLLGGILQEYNRKGILIDLWPDVTSSTSRMGLLPDSSIVFWNYRKATGHIHMWQLFQHLVSQTKVEVWPSEYVSAITTLASHEFAKQRNVIHYGGGTWIFDDLLEFTPNDSYGLVKNKSLDEFIYEEKSDFTFVLSQIIFRMAFLLLGEVTTLTNKLDAEMEVFNKRLNPAFHPYYTKEFLEE